MDRTAILVNQVNDAAALRRPLVIVGSGSRVPWGKLEGDVLDISAHLGIVDYDARELYITARAGTPLNVIEAELAAAGQMLAFEPPRFSPASTLGGAIASGAAGPRRAYCGAARDFVLGCRIINGRGESLHFGGQVMKNVAGYDVSRLMAGAWGTLGVLLELSLKVLPRPAANVTVFRECTASQALLKLQGLAGKPVPIDASCHVDGRLFLRLSGSQPAVEIARRSLGGESLPEAEKFWLDLRDRRHPFFGGDTPLWRLAVPASAPMLALEGTWLLEWGGGQRWVRTQAELDDVQRAAAKAGGHATLINGGTLVPVFHPLPPALLALHRRLKQAFDPHGILNPGRIGEGI